MAAKRSTILADFPTERVSAMLRDAFVAKPPRRTPVRAPEVGAPESRFGEDGELRLPPREAVKRQFKGRRNIRSRGRDYTFRWVPGARRSGWRLHMLTTVQRHTNTTEAEADHRASGVYTDQSLDWAWLTRKGYVTFN